MTRARDVATQGGLVLITRAVVGPAATINVTNCFSSAYDNYRIMYNNTSAASNTDIYVRLLSGTTAASTTYYTAIGGITLSGGAYNVIQNNTSGAFFLSAASGGPNDSTASMDIYRPFIAVPTNFITSSASTDGINWSGRYGGTTHSVSASYDGFQLNTGVNIGGIIQVFGYRKN